MWVAGKKQKIKRIKSYIEVFPGDPVPEAALWPNRSAYERQGLIKWVEDPVLPSTDNEKSLAEKEEPEPAPLPERAEESPKKKRKTKVKVS